MLNIILYLIPGLIWGSTWLVIKYQLGVVDPLVSVGYRFVLSALILLPYCKLTGLNLKFNMRQHLAIALQGALLFGVNYWLVYLAEVHLPSGIVAIIFSSIIFLNIFNSAIFLKTSIQLSLIGSGIIGIIGVAFIFQSELVDFKIGDEGFVALIFCIFSVFSASLGNILSARNQKLNIPVIQTNAFGMFYGGALMLIISLFMGKPFAFDTSWTYVSSLLYLSIFGSIIAFSTYLTLVGRIGPGRAGYVTLIFPIVALSLSTAFESYVWSTSNIIGVCLIMVGNFFIIRKKKESDTKKSSN